MALLGLKLGEQVSQEDILAFSQRDLRLFKGVSQGDFMFHRRDRLVAALRAEPNQLVATPSTVRFLSLLISAYISIC
jgi:hypothetical protein